MSRWASSASCLAVAACFSFAAGVSNAQNLVLDPHFKSGVSAWTVPPPAGSLTTTLLFDPGPGADGAPGFATLTGSSLGPVTYTALTCVPVQPGVVYSFGGNVRFRSSQLSGAVFTLAFFPVAGCGGVHIGGVPSSTGVGNPPGAVTPGAWTPCLGTGVTAPPGAASASLAFVLDSVSLSERPAADFDDVFVGRAGTAEPAIPIPFLSTAGALALGAALALVGVAARPVLR